jgi:hypothetical protein
VTQLLVDPHLHSLWHFIGTAVAVDVFIQRRVHMNCLYQLLYTMHVFHHYLDLWHKRRPVMREPVCSDSFITSRSRLMEAGTNQCSVFKSTLTQETSHYDREWKQPRWRGQPGAIYVGSVAFGVL